MKRNLFIVYLIVAAKHSWFWLGIWVLYYLKFTDYAGIGFLESVMIVTTTVAEIPTGAVADLLGKKKTLTLAFLLEAFGGFMMAYAFNFFYLALSIFIMCLGGALYSGTLEALVFDSLKQINRQKTYDKVIANLSAVSFKTIALFSIIGGFLYLKNPRLPFLANAFAYLFGLIASLFLTEPRIDTVRFSFTNYLSQTQQGFKQLFAKINQHKTISLLLFGGFIVILDEMVEAILLVEFGFKAHSLGIIYSIIYLFSAFSSQLTPWIRKKFSFSAGLVILGLIIAVSLIVSPLIGLVLGGLTVLLRYSLAPIFNNLASVVINQSTPSSYRATTISTFNMIKNMPYVLSAFFIGRAIDIISVKVFAFYLGLTLLLLTLIFIYSKKQNKSAKISLWPPKN